MPPVLIAKLTDKQAITEARAVAERFCYSAPVSSRMFEEQDMFSKTAHVTLEDDSEVIVQFKDNEIDPTKTALARGLLGEIVPFKFISRTAKVNFVYVSNVIRGTRWYDRECTVEQNCHIVSQLGDLLPRCVVNTESTGVVDFFVIPRLKHILLKESIPLAQLREKLETLLNQCESIKALPLALCHTDLNDRNIFLDENYNIAGIVDWEQATLLPIGSNAWCIRYLSVDIRGNDATSEKALLMAEAFWKAFVARLPDSIQSRQRTIITAMQVGFTLSAFFGSGSLDENRLSQVFDRIEWLERTFVPLCATV